MRLRTRLVKRGLPGQQCTLPDPVRSRGGGGTLAFRAGLSCHANRCLPCATAPAHTAHHSTSLGTARRHLGTSTEPVMPAPIRPRGLSPVPWPVMPPIRPRGLSPVPWPVVPSIRRQAHHATLAVVSAAVSGVRREWQPEPRHHRRRKLRTRDRELRALMRWECCGVRSSLCYGQVRSSLCYGRVRTGASC